MSLSGYVSKSFTHLDCSTFAHNSSQNSSSSVKLCQQHTTLHTAMAYGLLLKLSSVGPGQFLDGRPDATGSGVGGPVGGTLSSGLKTK